MNLFDDGTDYGAILKTPPVSKRYISPRHLLWALGISYFILFMFAVDDGVIALTMESHFESLGLSRKTLNIVFFANAGTQFLNIALWPLIRTISIRRIMTWAVMYRVIFTVFLSVFYYNKNFLPFIIAFRTIGNIFPLTIYRSLVAMYFEEKKNVSEFLSYLVIQDALVILLSALGPVLYDEDAGFLIWWLIFSGIVCFLATFVIPPFRVCIGMHEPYCEIFFEVFRQRQFLLLLAIFTIFSWISFGIFNVMPSLVHERWDISQSSLVWIYAVLVLCGVIGALVQPWIRMSYRMQMIVTQVLIMASYGLTAPRQWGIWAAAALGGLMLRIQQNAILTSISVGPVYKSVSLAMASAFERSNQVGSLMIEEFWSTYGMTNMLMPILAFGALSLVFILMLRETDPKIQPIILDGTPSQSISIQSVPRGNVNFDMAGIEPHVKFDQPRTPSKL